MTKAPSGGTVGMESAKKPSAKQIKDKSRREQSILSWTEDDKFIVEDRATASNEASFLSLNLHFLAEQLEKVDLSRRLFIEEDLLRPELDQATCGTGSESSKKDYGELASHGLSQGHMNVDRYREAGSSETSSSSRPVPFFANKGSKSMNQVKDELWQFGRTAQSSILESIAQSIKNSDANLKKQQSRFEAAATEAKLDMLLDSFNETNSGSTFEERPGYIKSGLAVADHDNALDGLLNETSNLMNQDVALSSQEEE
ncbi:hypothetical protein F0562_018155 [Nyssa sinensis]|uniref:Uncharacterized protein n=1 Tax=Nyssa sinensis TaxID=561372 RepID=A0A5J4ZC04_9ASTE|nr:hypothetical protein F0562_018155 [Nyssa sinensis]